jgi:nucleoside phosphorylase
MKQPGQRSAEALFGFALADRFTDPSDRPSTDQDRAQKMYQVLQSQLHMVARFWNYGIAAWDLRFVKTTHSAKVAVGLLCRISCPLYTDLEHYNRDCQAAAQRVELLFQEFGYDLTPLSDWSAFRFFLEPFDYRSLAEIRRCEDLIEIRHPHEAYEFYVTYPWKWSGSTRHRLFAILTQLPDNCLLSICLQPTRLNEYEQYLLQHATSGLVRNELLYAGPAGHEALKIYEGFAGDLQQPFLLRISVAASSAATVERVGQVFLEELEPAFNAQGHPLLQSPRTPYELQALQRGLSSLAWVPWGNLRDGEPQTARLRYLVDSKEGSMAFRLPITEEQRVVILTALPIEYLAVRAHISQVREETHKGTIYERGTFIAGKGSWEVVIAQIGAGGTGTAIEAERAITHFRPHVILFVGVAGGLKDVALGDIVVATKVYGYESGKVEAQGFRSRPEVGRSSHPMVQRASAEARKTDWLQRIQRSASMVVSSPRVFIGPIAAGDKVLASTHAELYDLLRTTYEDALAIEMESHGFLQATYRDSAVQALIVRGISDLIDNKRKVDKQGYQEIAARHASAFAFEVLAKLDMQLH